MTNARRHKQEARRFMLTERQRMLVSGATLGGGCRGCCVWTPDVAPGNGAAGALRALFTAELRDTSVYKPLASWRSIAYKLPKFAYRCWPSYSLCAVHRPSADQMFKVAVLSNDNCANWLSSELIAVALSNQALQLARAIKAERPRPHN